ncbi:MAG: hypothetical protein P8Y70_21425 [Candidatus Lokiarchaeota archaeon]
MALICSFLEISTIPSSINFCKWGCIVDFAFPNLFANSVKLNSGYTFNSPHILNDIPLKAEIS